MLDAEQLSHFLVSKPASGDVGLNPFSVQDKLRNGAFAGPLDYFFGRARNRFDVDFFVGNLVFCQPALCGVAVPAPWSGIDSQVKVFQGNKLDDCLGSEASECPAQGSEHTEYTKAAHSGAAFEST